MECGKKRHIDRSFSLRFNYFILQSHCLVKYDSLINNSSVADTIASLTMSRIYRCCYWLSQIKREKTATPKCILNKITWNSRIILDGYQFTLEFMNIWLSDTLKVALFSYRVREYYVYNPILLSNIFRFSNIENIHKIFHFYLVFIYKNFISYRIIFGFK